MKALLAPLGLMVSLVAAPAMADRTYFIAPMYGYTAGGTLDVTEKITDENGFTSRETIGELKFDDDSHYGLMLGLETADPGNIYLFYSKQQSVFKEGSFAPTSGIDVDVAYYHLGGSLYYPRGDFRPYVTASVGATHIKPQETFSSETFFSLGLGLGAEYLLFEHLALTADYRAMFTAINNSTSLVCDEGCTVRVEADTMIQSQFNVGLRVRF
ncbi:outer membrane beta-barrel protein [Ferrimonas balearica]|uniref:outer membrane beta-barrel protein n=1 Tax=Ferrimonas balearica TaxID=44012 RepID=UPI001C99098D|nr:outer membrane beta-barrel protein [Ferrimonas balearica]MBY5922388.1 porin family protein [Ferrimonas balearica]MBY5995372.1 porin family protein [Ferrimonas balearica]